MFCSYCNLITKQYVQWCICVPGVCFSFPIFFPSLKNMLEGDRLATTYKLPLGVNEGVNVGVNAALKLTGIPFWGMFPPHSLCSQG